MSEAKIPGTPGTKTNPSRTAGKAAGILALYVSALLCGIGCAAVLAFGTLRMLLEAHLSGQYVPPADGYHGTALLLGLSLTIVMFYDMWKERQQQQLAD